MINGLIILIRHANREPIYHWTIFDNCSTNLDAPLIPSAKSTVDCFKRQLNEIYPNWFEKMNFKSSPVQRCIDTLKLFNGLCWSVQLDVGEFVRRSSPIEIDDAFQFKLESNYEFVPDLPEIIYLRELIKEPIIYKSDLYDVWSTRMCYLETIDHSHLNYHILNDKIWVKIEILTTQYYNEFFTPDILIKLKNIVTHININDFICTHDTLIFGLAKLFKSNIELPLPIYLSSIRIEFYDTINVYYNDLPLI